MLVKKFTLKGNFHFLLVAIMTQTFMKSAKWNT